MKERLFFKRLQAIWKIKVMERISSRKKEALKFIGRTIYRSKDGESALYFGVNRHDMTSIFESRSESIKAGGTLTGAAEQHYRRVPGHLAWAALSKAAIQKLRSTRKSSFISLWGQRS